MAGIITEDRSIACAQVYLHELLISIGDRESIVLEYCFHISPNDGEALVTMKWVCHGENRDNEDKA